jgi:hypothetical protein
MGRPWSVEDFMGQPWRMYIHTRVNMSIHENNIVIGLFKLSQQQQMNYQLIGTKKDAR